MLFSNAPRRMLALAAKRGTTNSRIYFGATWIGNPVRLLSGGPGGPVTRGPTPREKIDQLVTSSKAILHKALTEPTPTIAWIQQFGAMATLMSFAVTDMLSLRILAVCGIVFFNMIPNYFKNNYLNILWCVFPSLAFWPSTFSLPRQLHFFVPID